MLGGVQFIAGRGSLVVSGATPPPKKNVFLFCDVGCVFCVFVLLFSAWLGLAMSGIVRAGKKWSGACSASLGGRLVAFFFFRAVSGEALFSRGIIISFSGSSPGSLYRC